MKSRSGVQYSMCKADGGARLVHSLSILRQRGILYKLPRLGDDNYMG